MSLTWDEVKTEIDREGVISRVTGKPYSISGLKAVLYAPRRKRQRKQMDQNLLDAMAGMRVEDSTAKANKVSFFDGVHINPVPPIDPMHNAATPPDNIHIWKWAKHPSDEAIFLRSIVNIVDNADHDEGATLTNIRTVVELWKNLGTR